METVLTDLQSSRAFPTQHAGLSAGLSSFGDAVPALMKSELLPPGSAGQDTESRTQTPFLASVLRFPQEARGRGCFPSGTELPGAL